MRPSTSHLLLVSLSSLLLLHPAASHRPLPGIPEPVHAALSGVCAKTRNPNLCQHTVHPFITVVGAVDAAWVLDMHIQAFRKNAEHVMAVATEISHGPHINPIVVIALKGCLSDDYASALNSLDKAGQRLKSRDLPGLKIELSAVLSGVGYCDDEFVEIPASPVQGYNEKLSDLARLMLDLATLIH